MDGSPELLLDPTVHARGEALPIWHWMRDHAPVYRHRAGEGPACWSLTRYQDVRAVYRDPQVFSSARGVLLTTDRDGDDPGGGLTLALTDPPRHGQLRAAMTDWFNERAVRAMQDYLAEATELILAQALTAGSCDVVHDLAGRLSMYVIGQIVGVPAENHEDLFQWTNEAFETGIPLAGHTTLMRFFVELIDARTRDPQDDLLTALLSCTVDGQPLSDEEVLFNCENLIGATENGRLALAGGVLALLDHPDQWERLQADTGLLATCVEEILRWTSSATHSMRTVTAPVELAGQLLETGDRVVLWIPSANRDDRVFDDPDDFDIARQPNRHLALGFGEHFCLGSVLARAELRTLFTAMLNNRVELASAGSPTFVRSIMVGGPETLPVRLSCRT